MRVAGVNIKAGYLFMVVLERAEDQNGTAAVARERFQPNANLDAVAQWADLRQRVKQFLAPQSAQHIALMETRQYAQWKYVDALARATKICTVMDVAHQLGVPLTTVKTGDVARTLSLQAASLQLFEASRVGFSQPPTYWTTGMSEAAAVAMHVLGPEPTDGEPGTSEGGDAT